MPPAFKHRAFRLFWTGNALSLVGTLAQDAGRGWLVRSLTPDPFLLTAVGACSTLPVLLLTLYTGAVADRVNRRRALFVTNGIQLLLALGLGALVFFNLIQIWQVVVISLLTGVAHAFDIPARQSMNFEMVGREDLPNAIALNSAAFNGARALGPAVGGQFIHFFGMAGCFLFNAASFVPFLLNLRRMKSELPPMEGEKRRATLDDVREGFDWVRSHAALWPLILGVAALSIFAMSYGNLMPIFARDVLATDARGFSALLTASGAGALTAATQLAVFGSRLPGALRFFGGSLGFCAAVAAFAWSPGLAMGCLLQFASGYALLTALMTANTWVQTLAPDELRGRVFSLYSLSMVGAMPIGALWIGGAARLLGDVRMAIFVSSLLAMAWLTATFFSCRALRTME